MLADVLRDPFDQAAAVTARGLNEQGYMRDATIANHRRGRKIKIVYRILVCTHYYNAFRRE